MSAKLTMTPRLCLSSGAAAWEQKNGAFKLVSSDSLQRFSVVEPNSVWTKFAALLTRMSELSKVVRRSLDEALDFRDARKVGGQRDAAAAEFLDRRRPRGRRLSTNGSG